MTTADDADCIEGTAGCFRGPAFDSSSSSSSDVRRCSVQRPVVHATTLVCADAVVVVVVERSPVSVVLDTASLAVADVVGSALVLGG